jgi:hypothetical protein
MLPPSTGHTVQCSFNIRMNLREINCESGRWMEMFQDSPIMGFHMVLNMSYDVTNISVSKQPQTLLIVTVQSS